MSKSDGAGNDASSETSEKFLVTHVRIHSRRSFSVVKEAIEASLARLSELASTAVRNGDVVAARDELERLAMPSGLTILYSLDHGSALILRGGARKAIQYGIGNVLTATEMSQYKLSAALYAPIRVLVFEAMDGTVIEFDQPSSLFALCDDRKVDEVARRLDGQLSAVLRHAAGLGNVPRAGGI
jgi:uncharacterized protein (DUF302 family)